MKFVQNSGSDRVHDLVRQRIARGGSLGVATPTFSPFAFAELCEALMNLQKMQLSA